MHQTFAPSRAEPGCVRAYEQGFEAAAACFNASRVHLVGLGCGGGRKDAALLRRLRGPGRELFYTPVDVGVAMALEGRESALAEIPEANCFPLVCDLALAGDLAGALEEPRAAGAARLYTFLGMIPNFEPETILPRLAALVRPGDVLLLSANLAPGVDYAAGVRRILPQYDNVLTRDWLLTFLIDLGAEPSDGSMRFRVEEDAAGIAPSRVAAYFDFTRPRRLDLDGDRFEFFPGDSLRLFFSYRHTPEWVGTPFCHMAWKRGRTGLRTQGKRGYSWWGGPLDTVTPLGSPNGGENPLFFRHNRGSLNQRQKVKRIADRPN